MKPAFAQIVRARVGAHLSRVQASRLKQAGAGQHFEPLLVERFIFILPHILASKSRWDSEGAPRT